MKKIFSIILCITFLFNVSGYLIIFQILRSDAREEMKTYIKHNLREEEMEIVVVSNSEIASQVSTFKFVNESEFIYKGKRYDIIKKSKEANQTIFYCINDKNEENLFAGLNEHIKRNIDQNTNTKDKSNTLTKNIVKDALPEKSCCLGFIAPTSAIHFNYSKPFRERTVPTSSPPPRA
jgi:hypothetical protein